MRPHRPRGQPAAHRPREGERAERHVTPKSVRSTFAKGTTMTDEHRFDTLSKLLVHHAPRRRVLSSAVALTVAQAFGAASVLAKPDICAETWPGKSKKARDNRKSCRRTRKTCKEPGNGDFCIVPKQIDGKTHEIAKCCNDGEKCCGTQRCCPADRGCCGLGCAPAPDDPDFKCCNNKLVKTSINPDDCGQCGNKCGAGEVCRGGKCVCDSPLRGGACECEGPECNCDDRTCPTGQRCIDAGQDYYCNGGSIASGCTCGCGRGYKYCVIPGVGPRCVSENSPDC
jgi:hypothetical protein